MSLTYEDLRGRFANLSDYMDEWQGIPLPLEGLPLKLHDRHPMAEGLAMYQREIDKDQDIEFEFVCGGPQVREDEFVRGRFFSRSANAYIIIYQQGDKVFHAKIRRSPDHSMDRLKFWIRTIGASDAWDEDAEHTAREKLRGLITERQWRHYDLTGSFLETSPRSRLTYVFRRLRPTVALSPRSKPGALYDGMHCLAVLCMHPIGYYDQSWGGCLVPSDDVIAHLMFMRSDEAGYWGQANQHDAWRPEAGL